MKATTKRYFPGVPLATIYFIFVIFIFERSTRSERGIYRGFSAENHVYTAEYFYESVKMPSRIINFSLNNFFIIRQSFSPLF